MLLLPLMRAFADTQKPRSHRLIDTQSRRQSGDEDDEDASVDMAYIAYSAPSLPSSFSSPSPSILAVASGALSVQRHEEHRLEEHIPFRSDAIH